MKRTNRIRADFYNNWTGDQSWDKPEGYTPPDYSNLAAMMAPELKAALKLQCAYRMKQARKGLRAARGRMRASSVQVIDTAFSTAVQGVQASETPSALLSV